MKWVKYLKYQDEKKMRGDMHNAVILTAMTIIAVGTILLRGNDPVYPQLKVMGSKNVINKTTSLLFKRI
jgi:hypothetical protein